MKLTPVLYLLLIIFGVFAAVAIPVTIYQSSSSALPGWGSSISPGQLSSAHAFIGNKCESCHTPHRGITAAKCATCHVWSPGLLMKPSTAFHATLGDCRGCHTEHRGPGFRPIKMDHAVLERVAAATADHPVSLDCQSCHATRDKHQGFFGQQCAGCHTTATWKIAGFVHPSLKSTDCVQCHKPPPSHSMMHFGMMDQSITGEKAALVDQCFKCHQTDSFNDIKGVGWFKMH